MTKQRIRPEDITVKYCHYGKRISFYVGDKSIAQIVRIDVKNRVDLTRTMKRILAIHYNQQFEPAYYAPALPKKKKPGFLSRLIGRT